MLRINFIVCKKIAFIFFILFVLKCSRNRPYNIVFIMLNLLHSLSSCVGGAGSNNFPAVSIASKFTRFDKY